MGTKCVTASTLLAFLAVLTAISSSGAAASASSFDSGLPLIFTGNEGQWDDRVVFRATADGATLWFTPTGPYYQFARQDQLPEAASMPMMGRVEKEPVPLEYLVIKATFEQANQEAQLVGQDELDYRCNYFLGNDRSRWRTNVANYAAVVYRDLYPGIDLKYYGNQERMEYDFIVSPGADITHIRIRYEGAESLSVNESGELVIKTRWGTFTEMKPHVYQAEGEGRTEFDGSFTVVSDNTFGFAVGADYDPALPLIIDPVLEFSTYLGGAGVEYGHAIKMSGDSIAYLAGVTYSQDFPMVNGIQETLSGHFDFFITKVSLTGGQWLYSTYFGGGDKEALAKLDVDQVGNVYLSGLTWSPDFPLMNAIDDSFDGYNDAAVLKLGSDGDTLHFSTYLGGTDDEGYTCLGVDDSYHIYVSTTTWSEDFPLVDPFQTAISEGTKDITLSKFEPSGTAFVYSTYLGGVQDDECRSLVVDGQGCVYMTGITYSRDFPMQNAYKPVLESGTDAFVTKFNSQGNGLMFSTYLGGTENDFAYGIDIDSHGDAYIIGGTLSSDFPTLNAFQPLFMGGSINMGSDAFVSKLSGTGNNLIYSSYLGGTDDEYGYGIAVDRYDCAYAVGATYSSDFPVAEPIYDVQAGGGDAFVVRIGEYGDDLQFSTYLGGSAYDQAIAVELDDTRAAYITGTSASTNFPLVDPIRAIAIGSSEVILAKLTVGCCHGMTGNVNYDRDDLISLGDAMFLLDWLYKGGAAPPCSEEADANGSGEVSLGDVLHLTDFLWKNGPPPAECEHGGGGY